MAFTGTWTYRLMAVFFLVLPSASGGVLSILSKLLGGSQLLGVEGLGMSLVDMQFTLFNIGTTDNDVKERLEALDKKLDDLAEMSEKNFKEIKEGIQTIQTQMAIDFSASGASDAEQNILNQIEKFNLWIELRKELKSNNQTTVSDYEELSNRLNLILGEVYAPLEDHLPKLKRSLEGGLTSSSASSRGVLCEVSRLAENRLNSATSGNYNLTRTLEDGPLLVWKSMLHLQETAIYIFNLSCQQRNETDGFCYRRAANFRDGLTSQRDTLVSCLDPLLMALVENGEATVRLQRPYVGRENKIQYLVLGWADVDKEQLPELQSPDDGLAQYTRLQSDGSFYNLRVGGSCIIYADESNNLFCRRVYNGEEVRVMVIPRKTSAGFRYQLRDSRTGRALAVGGSKGYLQSPLILADASKLSDNGHVWEMTEFELQGNEKGGRFVRGSAPGESAQLTLLAALCSISLWLI